jgi:hypothetical protein
MSTFDARRVPAAFCGPAVNTGHNAVAWDGAWSPPLHLNATAVLVAAALDGTSAVSDIASGLLPMLPPGAVDLADLALYVHRLAEAFDAYGLLAGSAGYSQPRHHALAVYPPTVCARRLYRLDESRKFLVDVGYRRIVVSVAGDELGHELADVLGDYLVDEPVDLSTVPLEMALVPAERSEHAIGVGFHHLYGPDNRTLVRSTDLGEVVSSALSYIGNELAVAQDGGSVWFRGTVLEHRNGGAFVVSPGLFRIWKTTRRSVEAAGYAVCPGSNLRVSDDGARLDAPVVAIDDRGLIERSATGSQPGPRQAVARHRSWTDIIGLALQNEGGSDIDDPASEAAFELVHQAFLLRASGDPSVSTPGDPTLTFRTLDAAWALAQRAPVHRSVRLDREFVEALSAARLTSLSR